MPAALDRAEVRQFQSAETPDGILPVALPEPQGIDIVEEAIQVADGDRPEQEVELTVAETVRSCKLHDMMMVEFFHHVRFLPQQLDGASSPVLYPFSRQANGSIVVGVVNLLDDSVRSGAEDFGR